VNEIYASVYRIIKTTRLSVTEAVSVTGRPAGWWYWRAGRWRWVWSKWAWSAS